MRRKEKIFAGPCVRMRVSPGEKSPLFVSRLRTAVALPSERRTNRHPDNELLTMKRRPTFQRALAAAALLVATFFGGVSGCAAIQYRDYVDTPPSPEGRTTLPGRIRIDPQASYVEVSSDAGAREAIPSRNYDRLEILTAITNAWNAKASSAGRRPVRAIVVAAITHNAGDITAAVLYSFGTPLFLQLLGVPWSCAYSDVEVALQDQQGNTLFARAKGAACTSLYYPQNHLQKSVADGINKAMTQLRRLGPDELEEKMPRLPEFANVGASLGLDRVIWRAQPTRHFRKPWGYLPPVDNAPPSPPVAPPLR